MRFYNFSERAYQQERARIKARSQQRDAIIHAEINKVKQEQQALEEQRQKKAQELRLQQQAEMKRYCQMKIFCSILQVDFRLMASFLLLRRRLNFGNK